MKITLWNIGCGAAGYHAHNLPGLAQWLATNDTDIALLQEVDRFALRTHFTDVPAFFANQVGYHTFFKPSFTLPPEGEGQPQREYGNLILSRHPIISAHHIPLPAVIEADTHPWETETRSALCVQIRPNEKPLWAATSHLACSPDFQLSKVRRQQTEMLVNALQTIVPETDALVFGSDLNVPPSNPDIEPLTTYLTLQTSHIPPTWPLGGPFANGEPFASIDHLFTRNLTILQTQTHAEPTLTDHSAVTLDIDFT